MEVFGVFACLCSFFMGLTHGSASSVKAEYMRRREALLYEDAAHRAGATLPLSRDEHMVNNYILEEKRKIMDDSRKNRTEYFPAASYFRSRSEMRKTKAYDVIRKMPKGGILHAHSTAIPGLEWLVKNATYRDHVWMCLDQDNAAILKWSLKTPNYPDCEWELIKDKRNAYSSSSEFDDWLIKNISLLATDPLVSYKTGSQVWNRFNKYFIQVGSLLKFVDIFRDYFRQALEQFYADGVQYVELRSTMRGLFDLDGRKHDEEYSLMVFKSVTEEFKKEHTDFIDAKIILSGLRYKSVDDVKAQIKRAMELHKKYPDVFIGYDLVAEEDAHHPLMFYIDALLYPSQQNPPYKLPYFFHAGETNWQDTEVDYNLADAILLNTTRIGHGFGLYKHPKFMEVVKQKGIGLEVTPISNQLLGLVKDLRNHPMVSLLADDYPIVISSDDPMSWEASPLSSDFYVAFMDMSGRETGLNFLKQLALNSIMYSAMSQEEKSEAKEKWKRSWEKFIVETKNEIQPDINGNDDQ